MNNRALAFIFCTATLDVLALGIVVQVMLSFAVPGTVIGVAYVFAFNVPPIEITGTGIILVVCFIFRNMTAPITQTKAITRQVFAAPGTVCN